MFSKKQLSCLCEVLLTYEQGVRCTTAYQTEEASISETVNDRPIKTKCYLCRVFSY